MLDKFSIIFEITSKVYSKEVPADYPPGKLANEFFDYCSDTELNIQLDPARSRRFAPIENDPGTKKGWEKICLVVGARGATVLITQSRMSGNISLRIETNPRKLGKEGVCLLAELLGGKKAPFDLVEFADQARVTSADFCIDLVGVKVSEIAIYHNQQGVRTYWQGSDNALESIYLYRKKKPPTLQSQSKVKRSPHKPIAKIYDRVAERASVGKPPPFGPSPVVRVEVRKRYNGRYLNDIFGLPNPFEGLRLGFLNDQFGEKHARWLQYYHLRRVLTAAEAQSVLGIQSALAVSYEKGIAVPNPNLVNTNSVWTFWAQSAQLLGVIQLIGANV